ncbi:conserved uncharacterized protein [Erwinia pyrifoliae Ep1/96]|nr:conserved uncharacterized protein [Erwinia pyrifoliae Ep1/96]
MARCPRLPDILSGFRAADSHILSPAADGLFTSSLMQAGHAPPLPHSSKNCPQTGSIARVARVIAANLLHCDFTAKKL